MMAEQKLTCSVEECARILGIGRQLAYEKVKTGEIPALRLGRRLLVPRKALERLLEQGCIAQSQERNDIQDAPDH